MGERDAVLQQRPQQAGGVVAGGAIGYVGTDNAAEVDLGDGQTVTRAMTGPEFLSFQAGGATTDLFQVIGDLADALAGGATDPAAAANAALDPLDKGLQALTTAQTIVGTRLNWIDFNTTRYEQQCELASEQKAEIGGADIAETITRLQETMTVLEASQASFVKLANLSLFSMLG